MVDKSKLVWQVRDVKHGKVFSFYSQEEFELFMYKFLGLNLSKE